MCLLKVWSFAGTSGEAVLVLLLRPVALLPAREAFHQRRPAGWGGWLRVRLAPRAGSLGFIDLFLCLSAWFSFQSWSSSGQGDWQVPATGSTSGTCRPAAWSMTGPYFMFLFIKVSWLRPYRAVVLVGWLCGVDG